MAVYILFMLLAGFQSVYATIKGWLKTPEGKARYLIICCGELVLLATLRGYTVGADTVRYLDALEYYSKLPKDEVLFAELVWPFDFEKGYLLFTQICALINLPKPLFLMFVALSIYVPVFYSIYQYSKIPYISILAYIALGFFSYSLGIFRQMMAMSIVLCGVKFVERKQFWQYLALIVLAFTIHSTAIIMVALYFLAQVPVEKYWKWVVPAELVCLSFGRPVVYVIAKVLPQYSHYLGGKYDVQGGTYLMLILLNVLLFAMLYLNHKGFVKNRIVISALALSVVVQALGYAMGIFGRVVIYFSIFAIFAFSEIAYVMLNEPQFYGKALGNALATKNWQIARIGKCRISFKTILWVIFIVGLWAVALMDLIGNQYITPYTFSFMQS